MRKFLRSLPLLGFALAMVAATATEPTTTYAQTTTTTTFSDTSNNFAKQDIATLHAQGIVDGYSDGTFKPDKPVTRAEFATMLIKAKKFPLPNTYEGIFRDAQRGEWFTPYAELSYRLGVTSGASDRSFQPGKYLTRQEMVKMTVAAMGPQSETARHLSYDAYSGTLSKYWDDYTVASWAKKELAYAVQQGMLHGTPNNALQPQSFATRAEVAAFLNRAIVSRPVAQQTMAFGTSTHLKYANSKDVVATAYTYSGSLSYTGLTTRLGLIAVDPSVVPLGAHLYVPGYGYGVAADTGGAIKQARVDLFMKSEYNCQQFGIQDKKVYVLD